MEKLATLSVNRIKEAVKRFVGVKPASESISTVDGENFTRRVQEKAYWLYLQRNGKPGDPRADWIEAERLVRAEMKAGR